jgi:hypothetical protein
MAYMKERLGLFLITFLIIMCFPLALIRLFYAILTNTTRAWEILVAFDRVGNAGLNGNPSETISSRAYRGTTEGNKGWCILCKILDKIQANHCKNSAGT